MKFVSNVSNPGEDTSNNIENTYFNKNHASHTYDYIFASTPVEIIASKVGSLINKSLIKAKA